MFFVNRVPIPVLGIGQNIFFTHFIFCFVRRIFTESRCRENFLWQPSRGGIDKRRAAVRLGPRKSRTTGLGKLTRLASDYKHVFGLAKFRQTRYPFVLRNRKTNSWRRFVSGSDRWNSQITYEHTLSDDVEIVALSTFRKHITSTLNSYSIYFWIPNSIYELNIFKLKLKYTWFFLNINNFII